MNEITKSVDDRLQELREQVLSASTESILPCSLSDDWLDMLLALYMDDYTKLSLAFVFNILANRVGSGEIKANEDELNRYVEMFNAELVFEKLRRGRQEKIKDIEILPADIETILTQKRELMGDVIRRSDWRPQ